MKQICRCLGISTSSYYEHLKGSGAKASEQRIERRVITIFKEHKRRYGSRRIVSQLEDEGIKVGRQRVSSILRKNKLKAIQPKSFVPKTTVPSTNARSPNLLLEGIQLTGPNQVWVGDITYLPLVNKDWCYLSSWLDIWSHVIVGWRVEDHMREDLVIESLRSAEKNRSPSPGIIIHSDGGGQYGSNRFRKVIDKGRYRQSMTRKDNHYDNAMAESLFSRLKAELLEGGLFSSIEDARTECFDYIEGYYNTHRKHSSIGYKKPLQFEREMGY